MTTVLIVLGASLFPLLLLAVGYLWQGKDQRRKMDEANRVFYDSEGNHIYYDRHFLRYRRRKAQE